MAFAKFLIVFLALIAVVCAQNTTVTPTPAPSTNTWNIVDASTASVLNIYFWLPAATNASATGYQLMVSGVVTAPAANKMAAASGAFSKSFVYVVPANQSSALWVLTADTTDKTYFTANVTYPLGPVKTTFVLNSVNVTYVNGTWAFPLSSISTTNPSTSEAFFNDKDAFFEIKSASTSFSGAANSTAVTSSLTVSSTVTTNMANIVVDFSAYPSVVNANTTGTTKTFTAYIGVGSPPGGHVVLIIIICVAAGVVLSIIIFVVIYLRRRKNYEGID